VGFASGEQPDGTFVVPTAPESALERQLHESISAAKTNGKPSASAGTPAPGTAAAPNSEQPPSNGNGSKPNGHAAAQNGHQQSETRRDWAQILLAQTNSLIDVYGTALGYAGTKYGEAVKSEDVRTLLTTAFINLCKQGGTHAG